MIEVNRKGEVWVYAEQEDGALHDVALELCGRARQLADRLGVKVGAVLPGWGVRELSARLIAHGVDKVYVVEDRRIDHYQTQPYAKAVCELITKHKPQIVMYGATPIGRDLAPRIASQMRAGLTADCTDLGIGDYTDPMSKNVHSNLLLQIRPAFGGNIIATIINHDRWPQMATVREGVMPLLPPDASRKGEVLEEKVAFDDKADFPLRIVERPPSWNVKVEPQGCPHHRRRRRRRRQQRQFPPDPRAGRGARRGRRRITRRRRWRIHPPGPPGRPDRHHGSPGPLHRLWHQRRDPAPRRHGKSPPRSSPSTPTPRRRSSPSPTTASSATSTRSSR